MRTTSFGEAFSGCCVVHAPFVVPERRAWFEKELDRVGVQDFVVVETRPTPSDDARLKHYERRRANGPATLSVADGYKRCLDIAKERGWREVVILEDDVLFRSGFDQRWGEVARAVSRRKWDVLFFYRWRVIPLLELGGRTRITRIDSNLCLHGFVVRHNFFDRFNEAVDYAIGKGSAIDTREIYDYLGRFDCRIFATSRNLVGQMGGFESGITPGAREESTVEMFRVRSMTDLSWHVRYAKSLARRLGRAVKRRRRNPFATAQRM